MMHISWHFRFFNYKRIILLTRESPYEW